MLMIARTCQLLLIDLQQRLAPALPDIEQITANGERLLSAADRLDVPVLVTEHCAEKIGPTIEPVRRKVADSAIVHKRHFSAWAEPGIAARINAQARLQVVVAGIEAHVCVLQTTLELLRAGYACYLVEDATGSRKQADAHAAMARLRAQGVQIVTTEMVLFEWLQRGDSAAFKDLFPLIRNG